MDDSTRGTLEMRDNFPDDKTYVFPDYKCSRHVIGDNIYHVKTGISDIKDEDFVKAAEEYKQKYPAKFSSRVSSLGSEREREREQIWSLNRFRNSRISYYWTNYLLSNQKTL